MHLSILRLLLSDQVWCARSFLTGWPLVTITNTNHQLKPRQNHQQWQKWRPEQRRHRGQQRRQQDDNDGDVNDDNKNTDVKNNNNNNNNNNDNIEWYFFQSNVDYIGSVSSKDFAIWKSKRQCQMRIFCRTVLTTTTTGNNSSRLVFLDPTTHLYKRSCLSVCQFVYFEWQISPFLDVTMHLYKRSCPSVRPPIGTSIQRFCLCQSGRQAVRWLLNILDRKLDTRLQPVPRFGRMELSRCLPDRMNQLIWMSR